MKKSEIFKLIKDNPNSEFEVSVPGIGEWFDLATRVSEDADKPISVYSREFFNCEYDVRIKKWKPEVEPIHLPKVKYIHQQFLANVAKLLAWKEKYDSGSIKTHGVYGGIAGKLIIKEVFDSDRSLGTVMFSQDGAKELVRQFESGEFTLE